MTNLQEICGNCNFFDPNYADNQPIGKFLNDDGEVIKGFCRAKPNGLVLGERLTTQDCKMPEGTFMPKEGVVFQEGEVNITGSAQS